MQKKVIRVSDVRRRLEAMPSEVAEDHVGQVLRRFGSLRARMAEASENLDEDDVASEVTAAREELDA